MTGRAIHEPPEHVFWASTVRDIVRMDRTHAHSQVELNLMLSGSATYFFAGRDIAVHAGMLVAFWGAIPHQTIAVDQGSRFVCVYLPIEMVLAMPLGPEMRAALLGGGMLAARERLEPGWAERIGDDLTGAEPRLRRLATEELTLRLRRLDVLGWTDLAATPAPARPRALARDAPHAEVYAMARFLTAHATEPVSVADAGRAVGLHPNYAMTLFRRVLGITAGDYLTRSRLYLAQSLLLTDDRDIASIAFSAGFGSLSRFHDAFRRQFGTTPHRFRQSNRVA